MKTRLSETEAEAKGQTDHKARPYELWLAYSAAFAWAFDYLQFSQDRKRRSRNRKRKAVFEWIMTFNASDYDSGSSLLDFLRASSRIP